MKDATDGRGGRRPGAGRPKNDSKLYSFRAPGDLAAAIDSQANKTEFIRNAVKDALKNSLETESWALESIGNAVPASRIGSLKIPAFDVSVAAGFPVSLDNDERAQDIELLSMLCPHPEASYLIRVRGDSMIDAGIYSGDIVIVDKSNRHPSPREIAVCELNGEYTLKRFEDSSDGGWLVPANPKYPKIRITQDDEFSVWGTVTYIIHKARD